MPPALVAMLPPMLHEPRAAKSTGYASPCSAAASCTACRVMPGCTVSVRSMGSKPSTRFMRARLSTSSPLAATAPPDSRVRPPEGTIATSLAAAQRTMAWTCSTSTGRATASGAGFPRRVQSRPSCSSSDGSVSRRRPGIEWPSETRRGSDMETPWVGPMRPTDAWLPAMRAGDVAPTCAQRASDGHGRPVRQCSKTLRFAAHWVIPTPSQAMTRTSYPRQDIRVLLLEGVSQTAVDAFRDAGYTNIDLHARSLPEDELLRRIADAHFVGIRSRTQLTAEVLAEARRLLAIGCFCIGTNQVDTEAAQLAGIPVFNAPYSNTRSVAELVLAQAIMLLRGIPQKNAQCHRGGWSKSAAGSHEARGK